MSESGITAAILDYLQLRGAFVFKVWGGPVQRPGLPDIIACLKGRFMAIEVKVPQPLSTPKQVERFLSPAQRRQLDAIARAGGTALVITDVFDLIRLLERIKP